MKDVFWYRNPNSGLVEAKEFAADSQLALLRVADPVLTSIAQGYRNADMVGNEIFPILKTQKETGRFPAFGQEAFLIQDTRRALYAPVKKLSVQSGYVTTSLSEHALGFEVDNRELHEFAGSPDQLLTMRQLQVDDAIALERENAQAVLATTSSNYASGNYFSGALKYWGGDGAGLYGNAVLDMRQLILTVQKKVGRRPNVVWFSPAAWELFIANPAVLDLIKYQGTPASPAQITQSAVAALLQVAKCIVGYAIKGTSTTGSQGGVGQGALTTSFVWDSVQSANAGCAVVGQGWGIPSFGYTYERENSPVVESYYLPKNKTQNYDSENFWDAAVTLNTAGGLYYSLT